MFIIICVCKIGTKPFYTRIYLFYLFLFSNIDLVIIFTFYRFKVEKRSYDPIDYESIDKTEFWILKEEKEGKLYIDELEGMIEKHPKNDGDNEEAKFMVLDEDNEDGRGGASLKEDENN